MTRWFYTDPLAAAWMAEHFGMRFGRFDERSAFREYEKPITGEDDFWRADRGRFYVHGESLHLLEPKVGDLVRRENGTAELVTQVRHDHPAIGGGAGTALYYCNPHIRRGVPWIDKAFVVVIERNGKTFHWPESEEA